MDVDEVNLSDPGPTGLEHLLALLDPETLLLGPRRALTFGCTVRGAWDDAVLFGKMSARGGRAALVTATKLQLQLETRLELEAKRRELAVKMGADVVVDPAKEDPYARIAQAKRTVIFECVGVPGVIQQMFEKVPRDARIVVVGVCMEPDTIEPMFGIVKELSLQFVLGYTPQEFAGSLQLLADGKVDAPSLITAKVGLDGVKGAFADLGNPEQHTKILVEPWR